MRFCAAQALVELIGPAGSKNRRCDPGLLEDPGNRSDDDRLPAAGEVVLEMLDRAELRLLPVALAIERAGMLQREARAFLDLLSLTIPTGQQPPDQRVVGDDPQALVAAER